MPNDNDELNEQSIAEASQAMAQQITEGYVAAIAIAVNIRAQLDGQTRPLNVLAAYAHMAGTLLAMAPPQERDAHVQQFLEAVERTAAQSATTRPQ